jgi:hypothetical protein
MLSAVHFFIFVANSIFTLTVKSTDDKVTNERQHSDSTKGQDRRFTLDVAFGAITSPQYHF